MWDNFWHLRVNERLTQWRHFRQQLDAMSFQEALQEVNTTWSKAPYIEYYMDESDPSNWPDPWTLLAENQYCDCTKALGMLYTIYFTAHRRDDLELLVYYNYKKNDRYHVVSINNGKHILNYWPQELVNTTQFEEKHMKLLYRYSITDLKLEKY